MTRRNRQISRPGTATRSVVAAIVLTGLGVPTLAGCGGDSTAPQAGPTASSAASDDAPSATTDEGSGTDRSDEPDGTGEDDTGSEPEAGDAASPGADDAASDDGSLRTSRCTADDIVGSLSEGDGGAAGSMLPNLVLENTGDGPCRLQGWPGVSFVGDGDGTQLGAAAEQDRSGSHATVTLKAGGHAHAPLRIARAENYPAGRCDPRTADGLRVYLPGETHSIFVRAADLTACAEDDVTLLEVQAVRPGAG